MQILQLILLLVYLKDFASQILVMFILEIVVMEQTRLVVNQ